MIFFLNKSKWIKWQFVKWWKFPEHLFENTMKLLLIRCYLDHKSIGDTQKSVCFCHSSFIICGLYAITMSGLLNSKQRQSTLWHRTLCCRAFSIIILLATHAYNLRQDKIKHMLFFNSLIKIWDRTTTYHHELVYMHQLNLQAINVRWEIRKANKCETRHAVFNIQK